MKKILILTPRFPYPVIGGDRLRIYHICRELSKYYELTLLSLCDSTVEMEMEIPKDDVFKRVERIRLPKFRSYLNCMMTLPTKTPLQIGYYYSSSFQQKVNELIPQHDLALAHLIRTGHYLRHSDIPKVLEMTDAISMNYARVGAIAKSSGFKNLVYSVEQRRLKKYEQDIAGDFDLSVFVSQVDKDYLFDSASDIKNRVLVCSNGVSFDELLGSYQPDGRTIVFIGNMTTVQNLDAARWFAKSVMPELAKRGSYQFKIIGRIKDQYREEFNRYSNTVATGCVDSVVEAAKGAIVGVCPMRLGAGVQNKVLEYMALEIPSITSSIGLEGIYAKVGTEILVADTERDYIDHIIDLANNVDFARKLAKNGKSYVDNHHTWSGKLDAYTKSIDVLL